MEPSQDLIVKVPLGTTIPAGLKKALDDEHKRSGLPITIIVQRALWNWLKKNGAK